MDISLNLFSNIIEIDLFWIYFGHSNEIDILIKFFGSIKDVYWI